METEKFFKTKGGRLTVAFAAILYSPFKVYVSDRKK